MLVMLFDLNIDLYNFKNALPNTKIKKLFSYLTSIFTKIEKLFS